MFSRDHDRIERLERRVGELENALALVVARLGGSVPMPASSVGQVDQPGEPGGLSALAKSHVRAGEVIKAIKQHRADTGLGLADAKNAVDAYRRWAGV